ncbi:sulfatase-like hydrolase/transferase [Fulvivirga ligni]|uniref:sulfatase-like hydrolase/transferase n=1 Tax=Fulvivirga ligni TaxID=2904246 RepID=UPI001F24A343|nr:sulfatase-like hydrolase/transferase [Fulvivirga ligni]UII20698.1 sulfatase-like hydrolase/transferase [Fulvivirga ligni]
MRKILFILFLLPHLNASAQKKPNILLFIGDDMTWRDCSVYGNPDVNTPNIQRLADAGMSFDNMFTATAMCSPTRQQILTGLFPARSGAYPNHAKVYDGVKSLGHHFKALGYNVALIGKQHYGPAESYPIDYLGGRQHDGGNGIDIHLDKIKPVIEDDKPFLLIIAQNQPHTPWTRGNRAQYNPEKLTVPDYIIDTKETREALVKYYAEITYADSLLGYCLDAVEKVGKQKNTIEVFTSEQGYQLPFGKWTCYDLGLKTGFIISWPGKVPAKSRNSAFTQYVDILPTLLDMVGADPEKIDVGIKDSYGNTGFDGKSFYDVIQKKDRSPP